jgi:hypothetical protein
MNQEVEWPEFFPSDVPPKEASPASGSAFRLVKSLPPSESDFLSTIEESSDRTFGDDPLGMRYGTSFFRKLECIKAKQKRFKPLRNRYIAIGTLKSEHGVQLPTTSQGNSHLTVWLYPKSQIYLDFTLDAEAK